MSDSKNFLTESISFNEDSLSNFKNSTTELFSYNKDAGTSIAIILEQLLNKDNDRKIGVDAYDSFEIKVMKNGSLEVTVKSVEVYYDDSDERLGHLTFTVDGSKPKQKMIKKDW